jgi:hypothetical protein
MGSVKGGAALTLSMVAGNSLYNMTELSGEYADTKGNVV